MQKSFLTLFRQMILNATVARGRWDPPGGLMRPHRSSIGFPWRTARRPVVLAMSRASAEMMCWN